MKRVIISAALGIALLFALSGCDSRPEIKLADIQRDIVGKNTGEGLMSWNFAPEEPRKVSILEMTREGKRRTIVIDMVTEPKAQMFMPAQKMVGKLRLHYEWIADQWNLVRVENLTFKQI
jgi:hypothetical protein